ncbi:MAG: Rpn family recombination-promoting nuclease/putative transposase [Thermodesulfobacteriota bacterium]
MVADAVSEVTNPHDRFFKEVFSHPEVAEDFVMNYLPPSISEAFASGTFRLRKDSFVDDTLREHFSDLLYEVDFTEGHSGFVFLLFEHKSYPQGDIAFQLFRYMARIWEQSRKDGTRHLSPVIPVVLYHGTAKWNVPPDFASLYRGPEFLKKHLLDFSYQLCDLSAYSDTEIKGGAIVAVTLLLLKHVSCEDLPDRLPGFFILLRAATEQSTLAFLRTVLHYIGTVTLRVTHDQFRSAVKAALPEEGASHVNRLIEEFVDEFRPDWIRHGMEKGIEKGIVEGRRQEASSLAVRLLTRKLGTLDDSSLDRVRQLPLEELEALGEDLLDFSDYSDLEKWLDAVRASHSDAEH